MAKNMVFGNRDVSSMGVKSQFKPAATGAGGIVAGIAKTVSNVMCLAGKADAFTNI